MAAPHRILTGRPYSLRTLSGTDRATGGRSSGDDSVMIDMEGLDDAGIARFVAAHTPASPGSVSTVNSLLEIFRLL